MYILVLLWLQASVCTPVVYMWLVYIHIETNHPNQFSKPWKMSCALVESNFFFFFAIVSKRRQKNWKQKLTCTSTDWFGYTPTYTTKTSFRVLFIYLLYVYIVTKLVLFVVFTENKNVSSYFIFFFLLHIHAHIFTYDRIHIIVSKHSAFRYKGNVRVWWPHTNVLYN